MCDLSRVPCCIVNGIVYIFGVEKISERQQHDLLERINENYKFDNSRHIESYEKYEYGQNRRIKSNKLEHFKTNRQYGYCMSSVCKNLNKPKHSAPFGI